MGDFKDLLVEWRYREEAAAALAGQLTQVVVVSREDQERLIVDAFAQGRFSLVERDDAMLVDVVVRGQRCTDGQPVLVVSEVAPIIEVVDVEQALRRATLWSKLGLTVQPAVAGLSMSPDGAQRAQTEQVWIALLSESGGAAVQGRVGSALTPGHPMQEP